MRRADSWRSELNAGEEPTGDPRRVGGVKGWGRLALIAAVAVAVAAALIVGRSTRSGMMSMGNSTPPGQALPGAPGTAASFAELSVQHSNECGLTPQGVMQMDPSGRLQGSCCSSMEMTSYEAQTQGLRRFDGVPQIPSDPYDVSISLARELLGYQSGIHLSEGQQTVYDQAMRMTPDQAPCCCHCWRWDMTEGLANYLIARLDWSSGRVATVVALINGCGGSWQPASTTGGST